VKCCPAVKHLVFACVPLSAGPLSLIATIVSGFVVGISFLLSVTFSIQDPARVTSSAVNPVMGIAWDAFAAR